MHVLVQMGRLISIENEGGIELDHLQQVVHSQVYDHRELAKETSKIGRSTYSRL